MDDGRTVQGSGVGGGAVVPERDGPIERAFRRVRPLVLRAVVGSVVAAALVGVASALVGDFGPTSWRLIGTIALFVFFALCSWYDADVSARRSAAFGVTSIAVSIVLLLVGIVWIWLDDDGGVLRWFWVAAVGRVALLHVHLLLTNKRRFTSDAMQAVTIVTIVLVGALAVLLVLPFLVERPEGYPEAYWRVVVAVAILDLLGTVLIPLTYVLFHAGTAARSATPPSPGRSGAPVPPYGVPPHAASPYGVPSHGVPPSYGPPGAAPTPTVAAGGPAGRPGTHAAVSAWSPGGAAVPPVPSSQVGGAAAPLPPVGAYPVLRPPYLLEWPRYVNGQPLPARADGTPDFTGVRGWAH